MYLSEEYAYSNLDAAYLLAIGHQGFITPGGALCLNAYLFPPAWLALALTASLPCVVYSLTYLPDRPPAFLN